MTNPNSKLGGEDTEITSICTKKDLPERLELTSTRLAEPSTVMDHTFDRRQIEAFKLRNYALHKIDDAPFAWCHIRYFPPVLPGH